MQALVGAGLVTLGGLAVLVGKYGTLVALVLWLLSLMGAFGLTVGFGWVITFILSFIAGIIGVSVGAVLVADA